MTDTTTQAVEALADKHESFIRDMVGDYTVLSVEATTLRALAAERDAANARADAAEAQLAGARDKALVDAAGILEEQALDADAQAKRFRGGSDPWAERTARARALRNSASAILALRDKPAITGGGDE